MKKVGPLSWRWQNYFRCYAKIIHYESFTTMIFSGFPFSSWSISKIVVFRFEATGIEKPKSRKVSLLLGTSLKVQVYLFQIISEEKNIIDVRTHRHVPLHHTKKKSVCLLYRQITIFVIKKKLQGSQKKTPQSWPSWTPSEWKTHQKLSLSPWIDAYFDVFLKKRGKVEMFFSSKRGMLRWSHTMNYQP